MTEPDIEGGGEELVDYRSISVEHIGTYIPRGVHSWLGSGAVVGTMHAADFSAGRSAFDRVKVLCP